MGRVTHNREFIRLRQIQSNSNFIAINTKSILLSNDYTRLATTCHCYNKLVVLEENKKIPYQTLKM